jgi:long-subunit fatty acid transport protein
MKRALFLLMAGILPARAVDFISDEFGGSPIPIGAGARPLGMGGAFTAIADDATANTWNPAGMAQLERPEMSASFGWYRHDLQISDGESDQESDLGLDHISAVVPFYAGTFQHSVGIAWQRRFDFTRAIDTAQEETSSSGGTTLSVDNDIATRQEGSFASISASYAVELWPGLMAGVTAHAWGDRWTFASAYDRSTDLRGTTIFSLVAPPVTNVDDITIARREHTEIDEGYSADIGLWWQPQHFLHFALVAHPEYELRLERRIDQHEVHSSPASDATTASETAAEFTYPTSVTIGAAWRIADPQTIAADVTWTHWSAYRIEQDGDARSPINPFIAPGDFDDLWSVRLGYEHVFILQRAVVVGRAGALYEQVPAATAVADTDQAEDAAATRDDYYGATLGLSLCRRKQIVDLGAQYRIGNGVGAGQWVAPDKTVDIRSLTVRMGFTWLF